MGLGERDIRTKEVGFCDGDEHNSSNKGSGALDKKEEAMGQSHRDIHDVLKETMAGSMREVIKDELQAWLGLKTQGQEDAQQRDNTHGEGDTVVDKEEGEMDREIVREEVSPFKLGDEEEKNLMISPMKEIVEEEEREARHKRDRRTSARQAYQRKSKDYEMDTVARATKRKVDLEDKGHHQLQDTGTITRQLTHTQPEGEGSRRVRRRL